MTVTPDVQDTIVAIASPPGPACRGVLRISGPKTLDVIAHAFCVEPSERTRKAIDACVMVGTIEPDNPPLPLHGRLLVWPDERSYTRQPSAEFHTIGSPPLLDLALKKILEAGARRAQPGEFTLRAFLSGRIDLTQAEAVLAVIDANSHTELDAALTQLAGGLAGPLLKLQETLLTLLADVEAGLDFVDEDIEFVSRDSVVHELEQARTQLGAILNQLDSRQLHEDSLWVVLTGKPNAGKSSLFNRLTGQASAIVSDQKGTTRDYVVETVELGNHRIQLVDTAGIDAEDIQSEIDALAQELSLENAKRSTLRIVCHDIREPFDRRVLSLDQPLAPHDATILLLTKSDLCDNPKDQICQVNERMAQDSSAGLLATMATSAIEPGSIDTLREFLQMQLDQVADRQAPLVSSTAARARDCIESAEQSLFLALMAATQNEGMELVASETRQALEQLAEVVGKVYTDDILDRIFSRFCIGK